MTFFTDLFIHIYIHGGWNMHKLVLIFSIILFTYSNTIYAADKELYQEALQKIIDSSNLADFNEKLELVEELIKEKPLDKAECLSLVDSLTNDSISNFYLASEAAEALPKACKERLNRVHKNYYYYKKNELNFSIELRDNINSKNFNDWNKLPRINKIQSNQDYPYLSNEKTINYRKSPVYFNADLPKGVVALTFDDGPKPSTTSAILNTLKDFGVRVTFFGVGKNIRKYSEIVRRAHDEGHSFGHHSNDHSNLPKLSLKKASDNIAAGRAAVSDVLNYDYPFFRFPYGNRTKRLQSWVKSQEMATFFWNIDTLDWKIKDPKKLYKYSVDKINEHQRGVILFHDIHKQTQIVIKPLIKELIDAGYKFVVFVK